MPAPIGNKYAQKPERDRLDAQIVLRLPRSLKSRAVRAASSTNRKLSPWLTEAIAEKCERDEQIQF